MLYIKRLYQLCCKTNVTNLFRSFVSVLLDITYTLRHNYEYTKNNMSYPYIVNSMLPNYCEHEHDIIKNYI